MNGTVTKRKLNIKKHGVSFNQIEEALADEFGLDDFDDNHSNINEYRYTRIGLSRTEILFVVYAILDERGIYRIISARQATKSEEKLYWEARYE